MGKKNAKVYGRRNSGEGAVLVKINSTKIIAEKGYCQLGLIMIIGSTGQKSKDKKQ